jgi:thioesterase domain-containing protein
MDIDALAAIGDPVERTATIRAEAVARGAIDDSISPARLANMADMYESNVRLVSEYQPQPYAGPVTLFRASEPDGEPHALGWDALAPALEIQPVPGDHFSMMRPPHAHVLARVLTEVLAALSAAPLSPEDPRDAGVET